MKDLTIRSRDEEQMDAPDLEPAIYARILNDLDRVNRWTFARRPTLDFIARTLGSARAFRLLDVGFGQGDMLRAVGRWARREGLDAHLVGYDLNPKSAAVARAATPDRLHIDFRTGDYRNLDADVDYVISNLVAHHMSDGELRDFLRFMEPRARKGWMINDLHRHRFSYLAFPLLCRVMGWHRIVREDGQLSIARSFRPVEWRDILSEAGISEAARIVRRFPFRLCVERPC